MSQGGFGPVGYTPLHPLGHTGHITGSLYLYLYLNKMTYAKRRVLEQQAGLIHMKEICPNFIQWSLNRLTPNDSYMGRTAPLTSKRCILYI